MCFKKIRQFFSKGKNRTPSGQLTTDTDHKKAQQEQEEEKGKQEDMKPLPVIKTPVMQQRTYDSQIFPADEPLIILLTEFLSERLRQLANKNYGGVKVPTVPDWKGCGYTLSQNFSVFVDEINDRLLESAIADTMIEKAHEDDTDDDGGHAVLSLHREKILQTERKMKTKHRATRTTLSNDEKWILLISLVPHIYPHFYDEVIMKHIEKPGQYPQLGFTRGKDFRGFCPTGESVFFMLAENDFDRRIQIQRLFQADHFFSKKKIVWLDDLEKGEPVMSGRLIMAEDHLDKIIFGEVVPPDFSLNFPARQIETELTWDDLVINEELEDQISMILSWIWYNEELTEKMGMSKRLKKGFRTLFYGPPGTGKTFTAGLLGNITGKPVYRIDLSMVVSKYIGETEKNLEQLFARAEDKGWILFFDEADAIFGKRTSIRDAHDKYANQEVSYLLQRIEDYNGLIIMASNMKTNIDESFIRRFNSMLRFPFPDEEHRALIWEKSLPKGIRYLRQRPSPPYLSSVEKELNIPEAVKKYELSGGNIVNVIQYAAIKAAEAYHEQLLFRKRNPGRVREMVHEELMDCGELNAPPEPPGEPVLTIYLSDIVDGIHRELIKEGKPFTE